MYNLWFYILWYPKQIERFLCPYCVSEVFFLAATFAMNLSLFYLLLSFYGPNILHHFQKFHLILFMFH